MIGEKGNTYKVDEICNFRDKKMDWRDGSRKRNGESSEYRDEIIPSTLQIFTGIYGAFTGKWEYRDSAFTGFHLV